MTITESPVPFTVDIPQSDLDDLARRVRDARLPEPLGADDWTTGVPISVLKSMASTWIDDFDWRDVEEQLEAFPQFLVEIDGQRIHYLHVRSSRADATPILLCHGWPGSYLEFLELIPLLTEPDDVNSRPFDVIVPSVPGFAFSMPLSDDGWTTDRSESVRGVDESPGVQLVRRARWRLRCRRCTCDGTARSRSLHRHSRQRFDRRTPAGA
ncbi:epoxide hydrolase family protein [Rhodococcoides fascians]|uniref:epoxide hydrolase family protein n=1 Tax=Rhodococcoides fascians TaxID=1828 RepID=UPI0037884682